MVFRRGGEKLTYLVITAHRILQCEEDAPTVVVAEFELPEAIELVPEVEFADGEAAPEGGEVLDEAVVAARVAPAFDTPYVGAEFAASAGFVRPDVAVARDAVGAGVGFLGTDVERGGAVDGFFEGSGDAGEFGDVIAPLGADDGFAVAGGDTPDDIVHESVIAGRIVGAINRLSASAHTVIVRSVRGVLLLEIDEAVGDIGLFDAITDFHAAGRNIAEEVPPFGVVGKGGVCDAGDEARDFEKVVDFGEVGVGEGVAGEAAEDAAGDKSAGSEDGLGDFAGGAVVAEEDDAFLGEHGVDEDDDRVGVGAACGYVRVEGEGLGGCCVGGSERLNELDAGEISYCLERGGCWYFDWDWNAIVDNASFVFVGISREGVAMRLTDWLSAILGR